MDTSTEDSNFAILREILENCCLEFAHKIMDACSKTPCGTKTHRCVNCHRRSARVAMETHTNSACLTMKRDEHDSKGLSHVPAERCNETINSRHRCCTKMFQRMISRCTKCCGSKERHLGLPHIPEDATHSSADYNERDEPITDSVSSSADCNECDEPITDTDSFSCYDGPIRLIVLDLLCFLHRQSPKTQSSSFKPNITVGKYWLSFLLLEIHNH